MRDARPPTRIAGRHQVRGRRRPTDLPRRRPRGRAARAGVNFRRRSWGGDVAAARRSVARSGGDPEEPPQTPGPDRPLVTVRSLCGDPGRRSGRMASFDRPVRPGAQSTMTPAQDITSGGHVHRIIASGAPPRPSGDRGRRFRRRTTTRNMNLNDGDSARAGKVSATLIGRPDPSRVPGLSTGPFRAPTPAVTHDPDRDDTPNGLPGGWAGNPAPRAPIGGTP